MFMKKTKICKALHVSERGFMLIEVLLAIAILGVLSGIATVNVGQFIDAGRAEAKMAEKHNLEVSAAYYLADGNKILEPFTIGPSDQGILDPYLIGNLVNDWVVETDGSITPADPETIPATTTTPTTVPTPTTTPTTTTTATPTTTPTTTTTTTPTTTPITTTTAIPTTVPTSTTITPTTTPTTTLSPTTTATTTPTTTPTTAITTTPKTKKPKDKDKNKEQNGSFWSWASSLFS
jgi:prepilin-type N-terminal cleavage/methylation domain-containing protein